MDAKVEQIAKIRKDNRGELVGDVEKMGKRLLRQDETCRASYGYTSIARPF